jgi:glucosamine kinase
VGLYLGVDGGGTKTSCVVGDETTVLGAGFAGPSNMFRVGPDNARQALAGAIAEACLAAGASPNQIQSTCIGLAGAAHIEIKDWASRTASQLVGGQIEVVGDMVIALEAAFGSGAGAIVIAGTGSIAFARDAQGETTRAGGWGFAISDEGSGHWIGRTALGTALRAEDAGNGSVLLQSLMDTWNLHSREELVIAGNAAPAPDFAELFPAVVRTAEEGDSVAIDVLTRAASELADMAALVVRRRLTGVQPQMAMCGGVFRHSRHVREVFYNRVRSLCPGVILISKVVDPLHGALALARKARVD